MTQHTPWELEDHQAPVDWEAVGPDLLAALEWLVDAHLMHAGYSVRGRPAADLDDKLDKIADQFGGTFADHILETRAIIAKAKGQS